MNMKAIASAILLAIVLTSATEGQEPAKVKVASIRLNAVMQGGNFYDRIRLLALDKETLVAIKKINADIKSVQQEIVDAQDQAKLNDLQNKLNFLNQKLNILVQRSAGSHGGRDFQALLREFVIATYKGKYQLILQQDAGNPDPIMWRGGVEITDITDEAADKLRDRLSEISVGSVGGLYPPPSVAYPKASKAPATPPVAKPAPQPAAKPTPPPATPTPLLLN
jgi:hypothetical protein